MNVLAFRVYVKVHNLNFFILLVRALTIVTYKRDEYYLILQLFTTCTMLDIGGTSTCPEGYTLPPKLLTMKAFLRGL